MLSVIKNQCSGCMACMNICPQGAIIPREDSCGFIYPKVVQEKCIECGLCIEVCDFKKEKPYDSTIKKTYGLQHKDKSFKKKYIWGAFTLFLMDSTKMVRYQTSEKTSQFVMKSHTQL